MEKFEYKVFWHKQSGLLALSWFDGDINLGSEITTELLMPYGKLGWEVVIAIQSMGGATNKIILKRLLSRDLRG